jgi:transcription elongation GreA/GreB family factor
MTHQAITSRLDALNAIELFLKEQLQAVMDSWKALEESNQSSEKSTAGDDHDTERAMLHIEMETLHQQIVRMEHMLEVVNALMQPRPEQSTVSLGSLVCTSQGNYLIGLACGKVVTPEGSILGISKESPLAQQLFGKAVGESIRINDNAFSILSIL